MIHEAIGASEGSRFSLCLNEIDGFESLIARMPTADECKNYEISPDTPVLIMQRRGKEQLARADLTVVTINSAPLPTTDAVHDAVRYVVKNILEDLDNVRAKIADFCDAAEAPPQEIVRLADEYRRERAGESL